MDTPEIAVVVSWNDSDKIPIPTSVEKNRFEYHKTVQTIKGRQWISTTFSPEVQLVLGRLSLAQTLCKLSWPLNVIKGEETNPLITIGKRRHQGLTSVREFLASFIEQGIFWQE